MDDAQVLAIIVAIRMESRLIRTAIANAAGDAFSGAQWTEAYDLMAARDLLEAARESRQEPEVLPEDDSGEDDNG